MDYRIAFCVLCVAVSVVPEMADEFLVSKWKTWYKSLDVNHDGIISREDVEESRSKFSDLHNLDTDQRKMVMENFEKWWDDYIFSGHTGDVSEQMFIDALNKDFTADKVKFLEKMQKCFDVIFDVIDINKDRFTSEDEFLIELKAFGHENVALDTSFFTAYKPKDGLVPLKEIVSSWVDFATSTDSSKPNIVKTTFEAGV